MHCNLELSIVIVNYNAKKYLEQCLNSIYKNSLQINIEIILVDNGSTDNSILMIKKKFPTVKLIENRKNEGFVKAANKGIKLCKAKYILSLNNDTFIYQKSLAELLKFMNSHPEVGISGPKVLNSDGTIQHQCKRGFPTISSAFYYFLGLHRYFPKSKVFGHYLMTYLDPEEINEVDSVSGACLMVKREIVEQVGLLDEDYIMYGDDLDLCYRIKKIGWKIYYVPTAKIIHYGGISSRKIPYKGVIWFYRAMYIFYKKHYAEKSNFVISIIVYSVILLKAILALGINLLRRKKIVGSKKN